MAGGQGKRQLKRQTRLAQAAFGVVVVGGVALGVVSTRNERPIQVGELNPDSVPLDDLISSAWQSSNELAMDPEGVAARLELIANHPVAPGEVKPAETTPTPDAGSPTPPPPPPEASGSVLDRVKFIGVIREPKRLLALLSIEGRQRIVTIGDELIVPPTDSNIKLRVVDITPEAIVLALGEEQRTINREAGTTGGVARVITPGGNPSLTGVMTQPSFSASPMSPRAMQPGQAEFGRFPIANQGTDESVRQALEAKRRMLEEEGRREAMEKLREMGKELPEDERKAREGK
ncbi:MAG: hypothetical protein SFZ23_05545 [Planctomycetota bacterium]|nr:hypothetical protein [Planctomycetota bacterium]